MPSLLDRFVAWGAQNFTGTGWHRVAFQPLLFLFAWAATARIVMTDEPPIPFRAVFHTYVGNAWIGLGLLCPPLALLSWWLIRRCRRPGATLAGMWVRLGADVGQFTVLLIYHIVTAVLDLQARAQGESRVYARYVVAACLVFSLLLIVRDVWALVVTERISRAIRRIGEGEAAHA